MQYRTDLAVEWDAKSADSLTEEDLLRREYRRDGVTVWQLHVRSDRAAGALEKPKGLYVTAQLPPLSDYDKELERPARCIGDLLRDMLPPSGAVLVAGLGNRSITPDALGPEAADMVLATRHIGGEFARTAGLEDLRPTAVIKPDVLGKTGVETGEILRGICNAVLPVAVIAIDALAARSVDRLGCTVQLGNSGISPGSGVGNHRLALNQDSLGVPVIAFGVPPVVATGTIAAHVNGRTADDDIHRGMMVTPREIDLIIRRAAKLVAMAINYALQPSYSPIELMLTAR